MQFGSPFKSRLGCICNLLTAGASGLRSRVATPVLDSFDNLCILHSHAQIVQQIGGLIGTATDTCHWWGNPTLLWWEAKPSSVCDAQARACSPPLARAEHWWSNPKPGEGLHLHTHTHSVWHLKYLRKYTHIQYKYNVHSTAYVGSHEVKYTWFRGWVSFQYTIYFRCWQ